MPNTVAQHAVATFTSPVNGSTPIDANTVRGNDNTTRTSYNNHDADPGIHVQSSTLASRPVAGTSGRKWITADAGSYKLWYDDGTIWHEVANTGVDVFVVAGETLAKGDVVKVTGYNNGLSAPIVAKVASASDVAFGIVLATISNGSTGYIANTGLVTDLNTNAFAIGDILYPNTSGGFTSTKPVAGTYQPVAYVLRSNTNNGVLYVEFSAPRIVERSDNTVSTLVLRDASGNFAAGTITANLTGNISGTAPAGTLTGTTLASNVVSSSLTSVGTLTNLTVTNTIVGSVNGNAATATALATARTINGVSFNGTADITVTAAAGTLTGATLAAGVTASSLTSVGTLGSLTVTAPITGSVTGSSGSTTGNAATATTLQTPRNINGVSFNGSADITVTAAAGTLSGATLASGVTASSLTSVGTLTALTVSGNLTVDTNTLFVDAANNRVGVGTASPAGAPLHVDSGAAIALRLTRSGGTAANLSLEWWNGTKGWYAGISTAGFWGVAYDTAGGGIDNAALRIDTSGNLGLGVTPSAWSSSFTAFQVRSASFFGSTSQSEASMSANAFVNSGGAYTYIHSTVASRYQQVNGEHRWLTAPGGTAGNAISFTQAMTLDASGFLGLGTTSISYRLDAVGGFQTVVARLLRSGDYGEVLRFGRNGVDEGASIGYPAAGVLTFNTGTSGGTERARIPAAGGMVVGTAALATSATAGFLYVPTCAGTPTGTPTTQTGTAPIIVDTTNHKLYFFSGGTWRDAGP